MNKKPSSMFCFTQEIIVDSQHTTAITCTEW